MKDWKTYSSLFTSTFTLSACTCGGGYVIVPLMKKQFVDKLGWIDEDEMLDLIAIAQSSPGSVAVNTSILLGYRVAGFTGALMTILGTVLPPLITLSLISLFYDAFRSNTIIAAVLEGMQAGVAAIIVDVVIGMIKNLAKAPGDHGQSWLIMGGAFIATYILNINVIFVIVACIVIGILPHLGHHRATEEAH